MAKTNSTTTLADMSLTTLTKPKTVATAGPGQLTVAAATINTAQPNVVMMEETTKRVYEAMKETKTIPEDRPDSSAEISIAVLAALDCIVVDQYKKDFSLFAAQEQKSVPNPNIEDLEVMKRVNSTMVPIGQFPSVDGTFYELDEGFSVSQEKEKLNADLATQNYSMVVSDIMSQNFSSDASTLKQLSATTLNVSSTPSRGMPSTTKKMTNTTKTLAASTAASTQNTMATTNYNATIKY